MSLHLGILFHWTPKANRASILRSGLEIIRPTRDGVASFPWICLGTTPSSAWGLIPDHTEDGAEGEGGWDLWQVSVRPGDTITVRTDFDVPFLREVRVHHGLPADRLWWAGERGVFAHLSIGEPAPEPPPRSRERRRSIGPRRPKLPPS